jgi:hypothetical protein
MAPLFSVAQADAFHKGALLVSASEGQTWANYSTSGTTNGEKINCDGHINGQRDPLSVEYGLSRRWGIGLTSGADIFNIDPSRYYGFGAPGSVAKPTTSEFTVDAHYHFFVTHKADISAYVSAGGFSVSMKGSQSDFNYSYKSGGNIIRTGICARYYVISRFGLLASLSSYAAGSSTNGVKDNTVANNYSTRISGLALEFGACFRFF